MTMTKSLAAKTDSSPEPRKVVAWVDLFTTLVEKFGWPGALLLLGFAFITLGAGAGTKDEIIRRYVLGEGIELGWPLLVLAAFFLMVLFAQRRWYRHRLELMQEELTREGREKSLLQKRLLGEEPHSAEGEGNDEAN